MKKICHLSIKNDNYVINNKITTFSYRPIEIGLKNILIGKERKKKTENTDDRSMMDCKKNSITQVITS